MTRGIPYESIPNGWFAVGTSDELKKGTILERRYFGREWVLWRSEVGHARMQDAYCPHLGAHLGSGCVKGESIRCPFHGFEFDGAGRCTKTASGARPPLRARLSGLPIVETNGLIFAWWHSESEAPTWSPPRLDEEGWTPFRVGEKTFRGHPQEISENSSDLAHFGPIHAYARAEMIGSATIEGHLLKSRYAVSRNLDFLGLPQVQSKLEFAAEVHGLGYSSVRAEVRQVGIDVSLLVLPTPIDEKTVTLRMAARMRKTPLRPFTRLLHEIIFRAYIGDIMQDVPIWARKRYVDNPPLAEGENAIAAYRRYVRQFYSPTKIALTVIDETKGSSEAAE